MGKNATQRAIERIYGPYDLTTFILAPAAQAYTLELYLPTNGKITQLATVLSAGTCTLNLQRQVLGGGLVSVTGLNAVAVTTTKLLSVPPTDGTEYQTTGTIIQVTLSAIAAAANMAITVTIQPI